MEMKHSQSTEPESITIALMGGTGAGKSTFVNLLSDAKMRVGYGLESCTSEVQVSEPFMMDGKTVTLIDTPGFDDTSKSEAEILRMISDFLSVTYEQGRKLSGIIFLHRISDYRMGGVARKNFRLFRKLCGEDTLKNVVIATNMWSDVKLEVGEAREAELASSDLFFKPAMDKGAQIIRHDNTLESAQRIIREIMGFPPQPLQIQRETVDQGKSLAQTDAGRDLQAELELQAAKHREEMEGLRTEMTELLAAKDSKRAEELEEVTEALRQVRVQLTRVEGESQKIKEEHNTSRREHEERMREMSETMRLREVELRALHEHAQKQNVKMSEMEKALDDAEKRANEQEQQCARADEELRSSTSAYHAEIEKLKAEFERKLENAKKEAAARGRPVPQSFAQHQWSKVFQAQKERRGVFAAMSIIVDQLWFGRALAW